MATRTTGLEFKFTADTAEALRAFRELAAAGKNAGGDLAAAGKQIEAALRKAEQAAKNQPKGFFDLARGGAVARIENTANQLGLGGALDSLGGAEQALEGLSAKAVVAAGAVAALGAVVVKLGADSVSTFVSAADEVSRLKDALGATGEQASKVYGILKLTDVTTSQASVAFATLAKNVGTNEKNLVKYGVVIAKNRDGTTDMATTLLNVASAFQATEDPARRAALGQAAFGEQWRNLVPILERGRAELAAASDALSAGISDTDIRRAEQFKESLAELRKQYQGAKIEFGRPLTIGATQALGFFNTTAQFTKNLVTGDLSGAFDVMSGRGERVNGVFARAADATTALGLAAAVAASDTNRLGAEMVLASDRAAKAARTFALVFNAQTTAISAQVGFRDAIGALAQAQQQQASASTKYADSQGAVASALGSQARAAEDGARRIAEAERRAADDIVRAQERIADARDAAAKRSQSAADRVADAERALRDAATVGAGENPLEQQRRIQEAQIELGRARRDQAQDEQDNIKDIARAEDDLRKAQEDGTRDVADARREAAEAAADASQRVADAQDRVTGSSDVAAVSVGNLSGKFDDLVSSTYNAAFQTVQMGGSQADVKKKVDEAKKALEEYGPQLGLTAAQVEYYRKQLELIPLLVPTRVRVDFSVGSAVDVARRGLAAAIASTIQPPQFAGGGTFRVPGGGAGLAILHDGEKVLTPDQQQQGVSITVNGYVGSEQQLVELISKAYRQGFR